MMWLVCIFTVSMSAISVDVFHCMYLRGNFLLLSFKHDGFLLSVVEYRPPIVKNRLFYLLAFCFWVLDASYWFLYLIPSPPFINLRNSFETPRLHIFRVEGFLWFINALISIIVFVSSSNTAFTHPFGITLSGWWYHDYYWWP